MNKTDKTAEKLVQSIRKTKTAPVSTKEPANRAPAAPAASATTAPAAPARKQEDDKPVVQLLRRSRVWPD